MIVFGGSGPVHGSRVARKLQIPRVICPWGAGVMSAFGLLSSPLGFEVARSLRLPLHKASPQALAQQLDTMGEEAGRFLLSAGVPSQQISLRRAVDMRYVGQGYELEVRIPEGFTPEQLHSSLPLLFAQQYRAVFGLELEDRGVEIVNWKVEAQGPHPGNDIQHQLKSESGGGEALKSHRGACFDDSGQHVQCPVYDRYALVCGQVIAGPALVEEPESTCVLGIGDRGTIDAAGNLVIEVGGLQ